MVDVFEEVEGQLRAERYQTLLRRYLPWIIGVSAALLIAALGYWGFTSWQTSQQEKASIAYNEAFEALRGQDEARAFTLFGEVAKSGTPGYRALALMHQGGIRLNAGATDEAVRLFDEAAKVSPDPMVSDFARLKSAFALLDTAPYADLEKRLTPLAGDKKPFRMQAKEALAFLKLRDGKLKEAREDFVVLSQIFDATPGMRERAKQAIALIDSGSAASVAAAVKQSMAPPTALPPATPAPAAPPAGEAPQ